MRAGCPQPPILMNFLVMRLEGIQTGERQLEIDLGIQPQ